MGSGKHRHSKDKLYIVASEFARDWGGYKGNSEKVAKRVLPFDHCFLTLNKFDSACCTEDGSVFDVKAVKCHISKGLNHPITGNIFKLSDLIYLNFSKDENGNLQCPLTRKRFNNFTKIVAIKPTGNVFSADSLTNVLKSEMKDPLSGIDIVKDDLIVLQDPEKPEKRYMENVFKKNEQHDTKNSAPTPNDTGDESVGELSVKHKQLFPAKKNAQEPSQKSDLYTTHRQSASFTCTAMPVVYETEYRDKTVFERKNEFYQLARINKLKGYVKIVTTLGDLNLMLHCNKVPITTDNFLQHCEDGYYDGTIFHRCIANFMVQGGDPTGTGTGGISSFYERWSKGNKCEQKPDKYFKDEFDQALQHIGEGVVSMANSGPNTNGSQFFITFKSCQHLDRKHSVFGKVVGGLDVLAKFEKLETDKKDRPKDPPKILRTIIYENPFEPNFAHEAKRANKSGSLYDLSHEIQLNTNKGASTDANILKSKLARIAMLKRQTFKW
ncbi:peptidyl-prolyl cis-trans isomerase-like 2 [Babesia microti strain RI]|uniref:Peptidyl-prolyl cis-trans isomerase-like 2 n=1 Tax=Babesia microti (strain RI) TaxID=1133968 RepID=I7J6E7_BABMR|nr:peptidyl-prolyl cis-trans isomerase-like 2 [Babesia microti strain RI]CCF73722.1 peptidyl-prolyl cis-trans isomerase-like 2 [Babesia microti strain RI]|eukprot:XP_012648331.1 peptidyl-prolyl cis-trans isomerase-like 2 [Babesia microti strain RI]